MKAIWKDQLIAESKNTIKIEGNHYFPKEEIDHTYLVDSETTTVCHWKGTANYFSIKVDDQINNDAAWYYATPKDGAANIKDYIAFWKGVEIKE